MTVIPIIKALYRQNRTAYISEKQTCKLQFYSLIILFLFSFVGNSSDANDLQSIDIKIINLNNHVANDCESTSGSPTQQSSKTAQGPEDNSDTDKIATRGRESESENEQEREMEWERERENGKSGSETKRKKKERKSEKKTKRKERRKSERIASRMKRKRRRNRQPDDDDDENNSYEY